MGIIGALTGIVGLIISVFSYSHNRIEAVNAYYNNLQKLESIKARRVLRHLGDDYDPKKLTEEQIDCCSYIVILYQQAGILVRKRQLPFWVFDKSSGYKVMNYFEKLRPYIDVRRISEPGYAHDFEYLSNRLKAKNSEWKTPSQDV